MAGLFLLPEINTHAHTCSYKTHICISANRTQATTKSETDANFNSRKFILAFYCLSKQCVL